MTNYRQIRVNLVSTIFALFFKFANIASFIYMSLVDRDFSPFSRFIEPLSFLNILVGLIFGVTLIIQIFLTLIYFSDIDGKECIIEVKEGEYINWNLFILISASTFIVPSHYIVTWTTQFIQLLSKYYKEYIDN